jgi:hypothetical protein
MPLMSSADDRLRVLVAGDAYAPTTVFADVLAGLEAIHEFEYLQVHGDGDFHPTTISERRISEYAGSPSQLVRRMAGAEVLVVHGACSPTRCCASAAAMRS